MGIGKVPYICDECWAKIECLEPPWCERCGISFDIRDTSLANPHEICPACLANPPLYGKLRATAFYEPTVREAIRLLKYEKKKVLAKHLMLLMQQRLPADISGEDYDMLVPIPLHRERYRKRGFNQSELLADGVSGVWRVPVRNDVLLRIRNTVALSSLNSHAERVETITGAFDVRYPESIRGKRLLLIDDIFTTGTTIDEAIRVLQPANPSNVDVLVLCRTRALDSNQASQLLSTVEHHLRRS